jgi:hypothetical protein
MATTSNFIPVPKPKAGAYRPDRPLSRNALVEAQLKHFEEANAQLPQELRIATDIGSIKTEGEASVFIRKVTEAIHKGGGNTQKVKSAR